MMGNEECRDNCLSFSTMKVSITLTQQQQQQFHFFGIFMLIIFFLKKSSRQKLNDNGDKIVDSLSGFMIFFY